ncbi:hypothetical protein LTR09_009463 [Extremus antarcticus]|uniref:Uncharacterized protein n=1 Tax=Extremus antarcticus TaxID=702011 RepID=A0AAJ0DFL8_9PEZI|nr:hypothetical protein LTR09_009463 [Extremus antarcticus]
MRPYRHVPTRSSTTRLARYIIILLLLWTVINVVQVRLALAQPSEEPLKPLGSERIFIASVNRNNEAVLRSNWTASVLELAKQIGHDNVFISIEESGSWDKTQELLTNLAHDLDDAGIRAHVVLDGTSHEQEVNQVPAETGWVWTPRRRMELRRIPYLSKQRNKGLQPLYEMAEAGERFDKILFLGDVVFTAEDVQTLVNTRGGEYAAACALDFSRAPLLYDTFAMRDSEGEEPLMLRWPFFRSQKSRKAIERQESVPVESCWNGMVAMDTTPFYEQGLAFRGIPDSLASRHIEGSECCLIHADNPLSEDKGVWVNPSVRVGYNTEAYDAVHRDCRSWPSTLDIAFGSWQNRILRWSTTTWFKKQLVEFRFARWMQESAGSATEVGANCLVNEMQVIQANGWGHV